MARDNTDGNVVVTTLKALTSMTKRQIQSDLIDMWNPNIMTLLDTENTLWCVAVKGRNEEGEKCYKGVKERNVQL